MAKAVATLPRVFLGEALRQLRADSGKSLDAMAAHIGKDRQRVIRLFEGKATLTTDELDKLVTFLGATGKRRREIVALGVEARKKPTSEPYTDKGPEPHRRLAYLEAMATTIVSYEKGIFPALLHGPEYLNALMESGEGIWWDSSDEHANRVAFRMERQRLVFESEKPKRVHLMFTDDALVAEVGNRDVMVRQFKHTLKTIQARDNLTVQIVPAAARNNPAQHGGITLFGFGTLLRPVGLLPVVYGPSTYFDKTEDTDKLTAAIKKIEKLALSPEETKRVIEQKVMEGN